MTKFLSAKQPWPVLAYGDVMIFFWKSQKRFANVAFLLGTTVVTRDSKASENRLQFQIFVNIHFRDFLHIEIAISHTTGITAPANGGR